MSSGPLPELDVRACTGCSVCVSACPCGAIRMVDGLPVFDCVNCCMHSEQCPVIRYGIHPCELACPVEAISVTFLIDNS